MDSETTPYRGEEPYIFVSYSHADSDKVGADLRRLTAMGVRFWFDDGIAPGHSWRDEIAESLAGSTMMLYFVSSTSIASRYCQQEVNFCHTRGIPLLAVFLEPVRLPLGLELSLGDQQALLRHELSEEEYLARLAAAVGGIARSPSVPARGTSEIKRVTALRVVLVATANDAEPIDPESLLEAKNACRDEIIRRIEPFGGTVDRVSPEDLIVYFGVPVAHEDDAHRAVRSALEILGTVRRIRETMQKSHDLRLAVRLGIQTGIVVVQQQPDQDQLTIVGEVTTEAAVLAQRLGSDRICIGESVYQLVRHAFVCEDSGAKDLDSGQIATYSVLSESVLANQLISSGFSEMVGRSQELDVLLSRWQLAVSGAGQAALVSGEPGIGKSRLTMSLIDKVHERGDSQIITGVCSAYAQHSMLQPFVNILGDGILGLRNDWADSEKLDRLRHYLLEYELDTDDALRVFANLLSITHGLPSGKMTPEREKQLLLEGILTIALRLAEQRPLLFVVEDLHWADATTIELLGKLLDLLPTAPVFCLLNFRTGFIPPWPPQSHQLTLPLAGLGREQAFELVRSLLGDYADEETLRTITDRSDGVPLFLEEVTRTVKDSASSAKGTSTSALAAIPLTLQESLAARLDQLQGEKQTAQLAAVIGREFNYSLLSRITDASEEILKDHLTTLVSRQFVLQRGIGKDARYVFRHALIRDTAYNSLPRKQRNEVHGQIAEKLISEFPEICAARPELVARHLSATGEKSQALDWWLRAGDRSQQQSANTDAEHHFLEALSCIKGLGTDAERAARELTISMRLIPTYVANYGYGTEELEHLCNNALRLCERVHDSASTVFVLWGLWMFHVVRANHDQSRSLAARISEEASSLGDPDLLLEAGLAQGIAHFFAGELAIARVHLETCVEAYKAPQHGDHAYRFGQDPCVIGLSYLSWLYWINGDDTAAQRASDRALKTANNLGHPLTRAFALSYAGFLAIYRGRFDIAKQQADALITLSSEEHIPVFLAHGHVLEAWQIGLSDHPAVGAKMMELALNEFRSTGSRCFLPLWDAAWADLCRLAGNPEQAQGILDTAFIEIEETAERWAFSELWRAQGILLMERGDTQSARRNLQQAVQLAEKQGAPAWSERASVALHAIT